MARTYRRRQCRYDYHWVLCVWTRVGNDHVDIHHDRHSDAGKKALARYHADTTVKVKKSSPRPYRKKFDAAIKMHNRQVLHRWLKYQDFDPVFTNTHHHIANWDWY